MIYYYPRFTGTYIDDSIFVNAGFFTGTSSVWQRQLAYGGAESTLETEIGSFLSPTTITGTYPFVAPNKIIDLGVTKLNSVDGVTLYEKYSSGVDRLISGTYRIIDPTNGFIMIDVSEFDNSTCSNCGTSDIRGIYKAEISFTSGYNTGAIVNNPNIIIPLCMVSDMWLKQMYDEGIGQDDQVFVTTTQIGRSITSRTNKFARDGALGNSIRANFIRSLIRPLTINKALKLG